MKICRYSICSMMVVVSLLAGCSTALASETNECGAAPMTAAVCGSVRLPLFAASGYWRNYPTAGVMFTLPSTIRQLTCCAGIEGGIITSSDRTIDLQCRNLRCGIKAELLKAWKNISVLPECGISSMMVSGADGKIDITRMHVFGVVENEYGVYGGVTARLSWRSVTFEVPVTLERIFSSPDRFTTLVFSGRLGCSIFR